MQALSSAKASGARAAARRPAFSAEPRRCRRVTVASAPATQPASTTTLSKPDQFLMPMWGKVKSEQEFFGVMKQLVAAGKLPEKLMMAWQDFYNNYRNAVMSSGAPGAEQTAAQVQVRVNRISYIKGLPTPDHARASHCGNREWDYRLQLQSPN